MHLSAWGLWATWGLAFVTSAFFCVDVARRSKRARLYLACLVPIVVFAVVVLPYSTVSHEGRPFAEIALSMLVWAPVGSAAFVGVTAWLLKGGLP